MNKLQLLSYGGGVQSVAMVLLVAAGKLPRPDAIVMADTGREKTSTWEYLEQHIQPMLADKGMKIEIAPHSLATVDLFSLSTQRILMPMYSTKQPDAMPDAQFTDKLGRKISKLPTYCSSEWKKQVIARYVKKTYGIPAIRISTWLGYSLDEIKRMKSSPMRSVKYPLINDFPMTRQDCKLFILQSGLPLPQKSACWMCPHMNDAEWLAMKSSHPQDFERAAALEAELQLKDPDVWLHKSVVPLAQVQLKETDDEMESQCGLGLCMI